MRLRSISTRQIHRRVGTEVTTQLVLAFVTPSLDYCNSVLAGLPQVGHTRAAAARAKRCCAVSARPQYVGSRDAGIASITLADSTMGVFSISCAPSCTPHALQLDRVRSVSDVACHSGLRWRGQLGRRRRTLHHGSATQNEIRRTGMILVRCSGCLELSSGWIKWSCRSDSWKKS